MKTTSAFREIESVHRVRLVRDQLERAITDGEYKPGDRLPSERELVDVLGVSRLTVREALRSLEALGWVDVQPGRGCFVAAQTDGYRQDFARWLGVHRDEVLELLRVRGALDGVAAEAAAESPDREAIDRVREAHGTFLGAANSGVTNLDRLCQLDIAFHEEIAAASGSRLLIRLLRELNVRLGESRRIALAPTGRPRQSAREHAIIVEAIASGDPARARAAVMRHISAVRKAVVEFECGGEEKRPRAGK